LADHLSRHAYLLEAVLARGFFDALPPPEALSAELAEALRQANDFQDVLDIVRRWTKDRQFQVGVRVLRHVSDPEAAGAPLADIADTAIAALQPPVEQEFARQHGRLPGDGIAAIALGKLGSRELTVTSDLDLIFVYDVPGGRSLRGVLNSRCPTARARCADPLLCAPGAAPHQRHHRADRRGPAVRGRHAPAVLPAIKARLPPASKAFAAIARERLTWEHMSLTRRA
jgi:glutamine synthetase adenylyltransferase